MASWERYLVQDALDDLKSAIDSVVPLNQVGKFYTEARIKEVLQQERRKNFLCYMQKIADIPSEKINEVVKDLNNELDQFIKQYLAKNEERKSLSEAFLLKVVEFLHHEYECCLRAHVSTNPYLTLEELAKTMESERMMVMAELRKRQFGNEDFQAIFEQKMGDQIQKLQTELLDEQKRFLTGPANEEEMRFNEMRRKLIQSLKIQSTEVAENDMQKVEPVEEIRRLITGESFQKKEHRRVHGKILEEFSSFTDPSGDLDCLKQFTKELEERCLLDCPIESQKDDKKYIVELIKWSYNSEIEGYLAENGAYKQNEFQELHSRLLNKLFHSSQKIISPTTGRTLPEISQEWQTFLEKELSDIFVGLKEANEMKLKKLQLEIQKLVSQRYEEYVNKMEEILRKNREGLERRKLKKVNKALLEELTHLLKIDVEKIQKSESARDHCDALKHQILQYWVTVSYVNENNLAKTLAEERKQREQVQKEKMERARQAQEPRRIVRKREPHQWQKQLDPIIFRLSSKHISMATTIDGEFKVIPNVNGEMFTPSIVGITENGDLVCGSDAVVQCTSGVPQRRHWWITQFLVTGNSQSYKETVKFNVGDQYIGYDVGVELLLGFIMRSLKETAEQKLEGSFTTALIVVPFWFCSTQRLQMKDAARVAGFSDVYLVNEESCAAYALASCPPGTASNGCILVLSENYGVVTAALFTYYMANNLRKVTMSQYNICKVMKAEVENKGGNLSSYIWHKFRDLEQFPHSGTRTEQKMHDALNLDSKAKLVREVCKTLFEKRRQGDMWPGEAIFVTNSNDESDSEWYRIFDTVVSEVGYGRITLITGVDPCFVGMFGASLLIRDLDGLADYLTDSMCHDVLKFCPDINSSSRAIVAEEYRSLPRQPKLHRTELPKMNKKVRFFQRNVLDESDCNIGELTIGWTISNAQQVYPNFQINSEAIITLYEVKCDPAIRRYSESSECRLETNTDFRWTPFTILDKKRDDIQKLIHQLFEYITINL